MIGRLFLLTALAAHPLAAQPDPQSLAVGVRGGIEMHRGGLGDAHIGLQAWTRLGDRLQLVPALDLLPDFPDDPLGAWSGRAWRAYATLRGRPFDRGWLPDIGYGLAMYYASARDAARSLSVSRLDLTDTVVLSFKGPSWRVVPYADIHLVNVLWRAGQSGGHLFLGVRTHVR